RETQQSLRESRGHVEERRVFHLLRGPAHTLAQQLDQMDSELRLALHEREKVLAPDDHQLRRRQRRCGRRARLAVEQRDLAERIAGLHDVEEHLLAAGAARADAHPPRDDTIQCIARVATHENDGISLVGATGRERSDLRDGLLRQGAEQAVARDDRCSVQGHDVNLRRPNSTSGAAFGQWQRVPREYTIAPFPHRRSVMARGFAQIPLLFACCGFAPLVAHAQYEVDEQNSVWLRALIDVRVARGPEFPSWTDSGPGKLRFGGRSTDSGFEHVTRVELANLAVQFGASLPWGIRAQAQLNVQPDLADSYHPWLVEAFLRKEWGDQQSGWGLQTGLAGSPFSLEHTGPAWTPEYTISASALDNWLWEEISVAGVEGEWWHVGTRGPRLGIVVGGGFGPDQLGRLLALRGWVIADGLSGYNADLPLPNGTRTDIFDERDDRPAAYALVTISDPRERGSIKVGYFDNRGDQNA